MSIEEKYKEPYYLCRNLAWDKPSLDAIQQWLKEHENNQYLLKDDANYKDDDIGTLLHYLVTKCAV